MRSRARSRFLILAWGVAAAAWVVSLPARATIQLGPWEALFKGVEHAVGTNTPGGGFPNLSVAYVVRVDLTDPDVRLFTSPRLESGYVSGVRETGGYTVSDFLTKYGVQVAVNGSLFSPQEYYLPAGTAMDIAGMSVCEGVMVSPQESASDAATLLFTSNNVPSLVGTNWPPVSTAGVYTAISGDYVVLMNGVNLGYNYRNTGGFIHQTNPRTLYGTSQDKRYLFLVAIDGRQSGYSEGALDYESGAWLLSVGAWDGVNMDGGGSTTLSIEGSTGRPVRLNKPSAVADSGRERTVGSHFGVFAKPAVGFVNDVAVTTDDTTATVTWTTVAPATSQVRYGASAALELSTERLAAATTNHAVALAGLTPGRTYYFSAVSEEAGGVHASSTRVFTTSNYVTLTLVYDVAQPWRYSTANLDGVGWTAPGYDDSGWAGPGPGLLWVDSRGGPRAGIDPVGTPMPADARSGGFPFPTYYFRTHFEVTGSVTGASLVMTNWLDDGAVFYLNGREVVRLRMEDAPAPITNDALAVAFGCSGDATCPEVLELGAEVVSGLVSGDNVLAVEVHNYNARSPDITFGQSLTVVQPVVRRPTLGVARTATGVVLSWGESGFVLQEAVDPGGPWTDVAGPVVKGPYQPALSGADRYYRLRR